MIAASGLASSSASAQCDFETCAAQVGGCTEVLCDGGFCSGGSEINDCYIATTSTPIFVFDTFGGNDCVCGSGGNDTINVGTGADWVFGGDGDDNITAGDGIDWVFGGAGADIINGGGDWTDCSVRLMGTTSTGATA
jgi:hypothetical protein